MLKKIVLLVFSFFCFSPFALAQNNDSLLSPSNQLNPDTSFEEENLTDKVCSLFTTNQVFSSEEIENSIYRSLGDILKRNRLIDVTRYGTYGQPEYATLWGGTSRQFLVYQDGISFLGQALYLPQTGDFDLFTVPLENIESIQLIDNPMVNILGKDIGLGGLRIKTKEYKTQKPFSRINFERGPYGYRRTQIDFGNQLARKLDFYFTGGWKKSDGYIANSDFESLYLTGNLLYKMKENWNIRLKALHFENRAGNPLPHDTLITLKTKEDRTILDLNSDYRFKNNTFLKIETFYCANLAESYNDGYFLDRKKTGNDFYLRGSYEFNWKKKTQNKVEGFLSWGNTEMDGIKRTLREGHISYLGLTRIFDKIDNFGFARLTFQKGFHWELSTLYGVSYSPRKELILFANVSHSLANPTYYDFYLPRSSYSAHLDSTYFSYQESYNQFLTYENLFTIDAGFSWLKNDFKLRNSIFYSYNLNNIEWTFSKVVNQLPAYTSIRYTVYPSNRTRNLFGFGLNLDYTFSPNFETSFSYAYKRARAGDFSIPYVPEHSFFSYFQYSYESSKKEYGLKVRLEQEYISKRYLADYNQDQVPFVLLFNSKITLRLLDLRFYYVIENITDEVYRTRGEFNMPGRTFWFGFSWDFYD
ncbi:MAG: TonB-dependent receptor plug domain-containing protein [candidate division Zixibacteria bacterium]|nr:TonB-dependent receptor plug domain-containing protein [candidate division Zixibacteria bacterium]